jgi:hypothetical protein
MGCKLGSLCCGRQISGLSYARSSHSKRIYRQASAGASRRSLEEYVSVKKVQLPEANYLLVCELLSEDGAAEQDAVQDEEQIELEVYHIGGPISDVERKLQEEDPEETHDTQSVLSEESDLPEDRNFEATRAEFEDIVDIIDRLYRLAAKLRSTTTRNPPSSRNFYRDPYLDPDGNVMVIDKEEKTELRRKAKEQTERFHYRRIKEIVRQAVRDEAGKSEPEESERVKLSSHNKLPVEGEKRKSYSETDIKLKPHTKAVIRRIAIANSYRQQQFIFWRQREWDRRNGVERHEVLETKDISGHQKSQALPNTWSPQEDGNQGLEIPDNRKVAFSEVPSHTWKMPKENLLALDETRSLSSRSEQTVAPTVYEPGGRKVGWPDFPKELQGKKEFICPYCFVTCPSKYRRKEHWR